MADSPDLEGPTAEAAKKAIDPHVPVQAIKNDKNPIGGVRLGAMRAVDTTGNQQPNAPEAVAKALEYKPPIDLKSIRTVSQQLKPPPVAQLNNYVRSRAITGRYVAAALKRTPGLKQSGLSIPATTNAIVLEQMLSANAEAAHKARQHHIAIAKEQLHFHKTVSATYMKHALTLQYQHLSVTKDVISVLRGFAEMAENKLEAIKINTKIPDQAKIGFIQGIINAALPEAAKFGLGLLRKHGEDTFRKKVVPGVADWLSAEHPNLNVGPHARNAAQRAEAFVRKSPFASRQLDNIQAGARAARSSMAPVIEPIARRLGPTARSVANKISEIDKKHNFSENYLNADKAWQGTSAARNFIAKQLRSMVTKEDKVADLLKDIRDQGLRSSTASTASAAASPDMHPADNVHVGTLRSHLSSMLGGVHPDRRDGIQSKIDEILEHLPKLSPGDQKRHATQLATAVTALARSNIGDHEQLAQAMRSTGSTSGPMAARSAPLQMSPAFQNLRNALSRGNSTKPSSQVGQPVLPPGSNLPGLSLHSTPHPFFTLAGAGHLPESIKPSITSAEMQKDLESSVGKRLDKIYDLLVQRLPKPIRVGGLRDHDRREAADLAMYHKQYEEEHGGGAGDRGGPDGHDGSGGGGGRGWLEALLGGGVGGVLGYAKGRALYHGGRAVKGGARLAKKGVVKGAKGSVRLARKGAGATKEALARRAARRAGSLTEVTDEGAEATKGLARGAIRLHTGFEAAGDVGEGLLSRGGNALGYLGKGLRAGGRLIGAVGRGAGSLVRVAGKTVPFLETAAKVAGVAGKMVAKHLPFIGAATGAADAGWRAWHGDYKGAGIALAGGAASLIPVVGTALSIGADAYNIKRDYDKAHEQRSQTVLSNPTTTALFKARMLAYGVTAAQAKPTLDLEALIYDNVRRHRVPTQMTPAQEKDFAKSFGFDPSVQAQMQYFHQWMNGRMYAALRAYGMTLSKNGYSLETEDQVTPEKLNTIIKQYHDEWIKVLPTYQKFMPQLAAFTTFIHTSSDPWQPQTPGSSPSSVPMAPPPVSPAANGSPTNPLAPAPSAAINTNSPYADPNRYQQRTAPSPTVTPVPGTARPTTSRGPSLTPAAYQVPTSSGGGFIQAAYHVPVSSGGFGRNSAAYTVPPATVTPDLLASLHGSGPAQTEHLTFTPTAAGRAPTSTSISVATAAAVAGMSTPMAQGASGVPGTGTHRGNIFAPPSAGGGSKTDQINNLKRAMDQQGITDPATRAGIIAISGGEGGFKPRSESSYRHTSNARLRMLFPSSMSGLSDAQINQAKSSDQALFNIIYGGSKGRELGNTQQDDGYTYRGRGDIQLTGRANYAKYGKMAGVDLINNPDLMNDPTISAKVSVAYMKDRYHGGGFEAMKRAVGASVGGPDATKNRLFAQYMQSGAMAGPASTPSPMAGQVASASPPGTPASGGPAIPVSFSPGSIPSGGAIPGSLGGGSMPPIPGVGPSGGGGGRGRGNIFAPHGANDNRMTGGPTGPLPLDCLPQGVVGSGQCVDLVKKASGLGQTSSWNAGDKVMGNPNIKPGTPIAVFDQNGKYGNHTNGTSHAAIYLGPSLTKPGGIRVYDQWAGKAASVRDIGPSAGSPVNNATYYRVIDTAKGPAPNAFRNAPPGSMPTPSSPPGADGQSGTQVHGSDSALQKAKDPNALPPGVPSAGGITPQGTTTSPLGGTPEQHGNMFMPPGQPGGATLPMGPAAAPPTSPSTSPDGGAGSGIPTGSRRPHRNIFAPPGSSSTGAAPGGPGGPSSNDNSSPGGELGSLSSHFESGAKGSMAMAPDTGNTYSYGKYQINSKTMPAFVKWAASQGASGAAVAKALASAGNSANPGSGFGNAWKQMVSSGSMGDLEHGFIKHTHYDVAFAKLSPDMQARVQKSPALQQVLWSTAVQHGPGLGIGAAGIFNKAGGNAKGSDQDLIKGIYQERIKHFSNPAVQAQEAKRYQQETKLALNISNQPPPTMNASVKPGGLVSPDGAGATNKSPGMVATATPGGATPSAPGASPDTTGSATPAAAAGGDSTAPQVAADRTPVGAAPGTQTATAAPGASPSDDTPPSGPSQNVMAPVQRAAAVSNDQHRERMVAEHHRRMGATPPGQEAQLAASRGIPLQLPPEFMTNHRQQTNASQEVLQVMRQVAGGISGLHAHMRDAHGSGGIFGKINEGIKDVSKAGSTVFAPTIASQQPPQNQQNIGLDVMKKRQPRYAV